MVQFAVVIKLLQTIACSRYLRTIEKLPMATDINSEFSDSQLYHWHQMAANGIVHCFIGQGGATFDFA